MSENLREFDGLTSAPPNENNAEENQEDAEDNEENYNTTGQEEEDYEERENEDEEEDDEDDETDMYHNPFYLPTELLNPSKSKSDLNNLMNQDDGLVEENVGIISALPPKLSQQDDAQIEISSTPAFQCLEEVIQIGNVFLIFDFSYFSLISFFKTAN